MTVPTTGSEPVARLCASCTVPATGPDELCDFCRRYDGPPILDSTLTGPGDLPANHRVVSAPLDITVADLADAFNVTTEAIGVLEKVLEEYPADAALFGLVDAVGALAHLRAARRLVDHAATRTTAVTAVVR